MESRHDPAATAATTRDARAWTQILARYRQPSTGRSIVEIVITVVPLAILWVLAWATLDVGYWLALPPMDIRYGDILRMTNGALALVPCASRFAHEPCKNCVPEETCELRRIMLLVRDETAAILDRLTLADRFDAGDDDKEEGSA